MSIDTLSPYKAGQQCSTTAEFRLTDPNIELGEKDAEVVTSWAARQPCNSLHLGEESGDLETLDDQIPTTRPSSEDGQAQPALNCSAFPVPMQSDGYQGLHKVLLHAAYGGPKCVHQRNREDVGGRADRAAHLHHQETDVLPGGRAVTANSNLQGLLKHAGLRTRRRIFVSITGT